MSTSRWNGCSFGWLLLTRAMFGFSGNDRLQFIFAVSCAQCPKTDKAFLPCAFDRSVLSSFDFIALLFQLLQKTLEILGLFGQGCCRLRAQTVTIAFFGWIKCALLPLPVRLDLNDRQLMFQANQIAQPLHSQPGQ